MSSERLRCVHRFALAGRSRDHALRRSLACSTCFAVSLDRRGASLLDAKPSHRGIGDIPRADFGSTGGRALAATARRCCTWPPSSDNLEAVARLLVERGADVNARADVDEHGVGGQTLHSATQFSDHGLPVSRLLVERGANLAIRAKVPGHYEQPGEVFEGTALEYAEQLQDVDSPGDKARTVAFLRQR